MTALPIGSLVKVQTYDEHRLKGRLTAVTASSFELRMAKNERIQTVTVEFENAKSVKLVDQNEAGSAVKAALEDIGGGILFVVLMIFFGAYES